MLAKLISYVSDFPVYSLFLFMFSTFLGSLGAYFLLRRAYLAFYVIISTSMVFFSGLAFGHDSLHHGFRLSELNAMFQEGSLSAFVQFDQFALPIFHFYSPVVYIVATPLLELTGTPVAALNIVSAAVCALLATGIIILARIVCERQRMPFRNGVLAATLLLSSNYIISNFMTRFALPEAMAFAFVPLVLSAILTRRFTLGAVLLALQISVHPPVNLILLPLVVLSTFILDRTAWGFRYSFLASLLVALALSSLFWVPGLTQKNLIFGVTKVEGLDLPHSAIENSFLTAAAFFEPLSFTNLGLIMPAALLVMVNLYRPSIKTPVFGAVALCAASLLMQYNGFKELTLLLPIIEISQFIWRWMLFSAFMGFISLLLMSPALPIWLVRPFMALAYASILLIGMLGSFPEGTKVLNSEDDLAAYRSYGPRSWGVTEYLPAYAFRPDQACAGPHSRNIHFASAANQELLVRSGESILIKWAPLVSTQYAYDAAHVSMKACGDGLLFAGDETGGTLTIRFDSGSALLAGKILMTIALISAAVCLCFASLNRASVSLRDKTGLEGRFYRTRS